MVLCRPSLAVAVTFTVCEPFASKVESITNAQPTSAAGQPMLLGDFGRVVKSLIDAGSPWDAAMYPTGDARVDEVLQPFISRAG